jgi:hypothetical protein
MLVSHHPREANLRVMTSWIDRGDARCRGPPQAECASPFSFYFQDEWCDLHEFIPSGPSLDTRYPQGGEQTMDWHMIATADWHGLCELILRLMSLV